MKSRLLVLMTTIVLAVITAIIVTKSRQAEASTPAATSIGAVRHDAIDVSMIRLLAMPQEYSKKVIRVVGYLNIEFEGNAVYFHEEDFRRSLTSNALWVDAKPEIMNGLKKLSGQYVLLEGVFDATDHGHMGVFSGALREVYRADAWAYKRNN